MYEIKSRRHQQNCLWPGNEMMLVLHAAHREAC